MSNFHLFRWQLLAVIFATLLGIACGNDVAPLSADDVLFQDSFLPEAPGPWQIEADESGRATLFEGQLLIEVDAPQTVQYVTLSEPTFGNFILEVDVTQTAGHLESSAGIMFRIISPYEFYRFEITSNGLYMIERHNADGTWTRFIEDWTESQAIIQGLNQTNHLKIVAEGSSLSFYVNDSLLLEVLDSSYPSGNLALSAGTFGQAGLKVTFDNVVARRP